VSWWRPGWGLVDISAESLLGPGWAGPCWRLVLGLGEDQVGALCKLVLGLCGDKCWVLVETSEGA
jgi:hypothetical protein